MKLPALLIPLLMSALTPSSSEAGILETLYGTLPDGRPVKIWTLTNASGLEARITEFGAILVSLRAPDREGNFADLTLGYDRLEDWLENPPYFGATVGRFGNRIAHGKFTLDGREFTLATNNAPAGLPCAIHGGVEGFHKKLWKGESFRENGLCGVRLHYTSPDGEEGYPGELEVEVVYILNDANELIWEASARTQAPTVINLVHHSYWNLSGDPRRSIEDHELTLNASHYLATNAGLIPTGKRVPVAGTPLDFLQPTVIGKRINAEEEALQLAGGYDQAWLIDRQEAGAMVTAARLRDPQSGRVMTLSTNQPAVQFYSGNFLDGSIRGKGGVRYARRSGLCLETENWPDAPNQPEAPSALLRPGETYVHRMVHRFTVE